jgi:plasmid stabilization system protein ParE
MRKIYKTPEVERQYKRIFKETIKRFGESVALETMHQLESAERQLANDTAYTKHDPEYRSERFEYISIPNSQTLFFEEIGNDIVIVAAGWSGRNWKDRLEEMQPYIDAQLKNLKKKKS